MARKSPENSFHIARKNTPVRRTVREAVDVLRLVRVQGEVVGTETHPRKVTKKYADDRAYSIRSFESTQALTAAEIRVYKRRFFDRKGEKGFVVKGGDGLGEIRMGSLTAGTIVDARDIGVKSAAVSQPDAVLMVKEVSETAEATNKSIITAELSINNAEAAMFGVIKAGDDITDKAQVGPNGTLIVRGDVDKLVADGAVNHVAKTIVGGNVVTAITLFDYTDTVVQGEIRGERQVFGRHNTINGAIVN